MATEQTVSEKSAERQAAELAEQRRLKCNTYEVNALDYGDHDSSLRHTLANLLCMGRVVKRSEGDDMIPERALMEWAALTNKAVAMALMHTSMVEDEHDAVLYDVEAGKVLLGVAAVLEAAPKLIGAFTLANIDLRSNGGSCPLDEGDEEAEVQP